jgi:hypothetical protein
VSLLNGKAVIIGFFSLSLAAAAVMSGLSFDYPGDAVVSDTKMQGLEDSGAVKGLDEGAVPGGDFIPESDGVELLADNHSDLDQEIFLGPLDADYGVVDSVGETAVPDLLPVWWYDLGRCGNTVYGRVGHLHVDITADVLDGTWRHDPSGRFLVSCDGVGLYPADLVFYRRGGGVDWFSPLPGSYRLGVKCGRTGFFYDLNDCGDLGVYLNISGLNVTSYMGQDTGLEFALDEAEGSYDVLDNPYLDRFRGLGYRIVQLRISYLCPSCVPAVNRNVMGEPGVKSRSLGYRQDISYVIFDPEVVGVDRIVELAGSGGDVWVLGVDEL